MAKIVLLRNLLLLLILLCVLNYVFYVNHQNFKDKLQLFNASKRIDWHDYNFIKIEKQRKGLGEQGQAVILTNESEKERSKVMIKEFSYNTVASDKISLNRSINDTRPRDCQRFKYLADLPPVSIIIVFHNEYLSFLLRTIHSIINRTPSQLLKEIILVDDFSTKGFIDVQLDWHLITTFPQHDIRTLRLKERHGLIRARMVGILNSTSDIVVVMDAHMEVNTNWLPPLIEPILYNFKTITEPVVDYIDWNTLKYSNGGIGITGAFNWHLTYIMLGRKLKPNENAAENFNTPVILGAIAAFNKNYFWSIGGYDPGLEVWGGEQYDLSFKVWMCGGQILQIPCSRVGHNYKGSGYHPFISNSSYIKPNLKRIAEVWLDEYKEEFYANSGSRNIDAGYLLPQKELRQRLGCKSFKWYLDNLLPDLLERYPVDMSQFVAYGAIQSVSQPKYCVDDLGVKNGQPIGLYGCHSQNLTDTLPPQFFLLTKQNEIRLKRDPNCWDVAEPSENKNEKILVKLYGCHHQRGNQYFEYDQKTQQIKAHSKYCLEGDFGDMNAPKLFMAKCDELSINQKWKWHLQTS